MSLLELIAAADERGLAASAVACLDRCLPQPVDGADPDPLRPLWAGCTDAALWPDRLAEVRAVLDAAADEEGAAPRIRRLLGEAPVDRAVPGLREWADACSLLALEVHLGPDPAEAADAETVRRCREGDPDGAGPLPAGELRRQIRILELLAETADASAAGAGLRQVLDVSAEGQRVLRAAVSRRARRDPNERP
ncbi:hypothetical protein OG978_25085 [Streptomyces sp. NBC_01591]|uniref:hypothetical protein n=1 Tax=Streptomyces sp. NBC_01591 TaxID=2975888 RepID=UPI002DD83401|nr:hypothetical protein [Streptomyces sp. NBC_01591]WSD70363.1 hypothetical protein OG978_25085 [Streptomyces sp. NBC_01591]